MVLKRRLPRITARDLLPIVPFGAHFPSRPDNLASVETFAGAACLTNFPAMRTRRDKYCEVFQSARSGSPPGDGHWTPRWSEPLTTNS